MQTSNPPSIKILLKLITIHRLTLNKQLTSIIKGQFFILLLNDFVS